MFFDKSIKLSRLLQIIYEAERLKLVKNEDVYRDEYWYEDKYIFDKFYITKKYEKGSWNEQKNVRVSITLYDNQNELLVYESGQYDLDDYENKIRLFTKELERKDEYISWKHEGVWRDFIITELEKLEQKVYDKKIEIRKNEQAQLRKEKEELADRKEYFNNLFAKKGNETINK